MEKINTEHPFEGDMAADEPMSAHTTFKVGGPADLWVRPAPSVFPEFSAALLAAARAEGIPVFLLGRGANIVVSDRGIRGIVLDLTAWTGIEFAAGAAEGDANDGSAGGAAGRAAGTVYVRSGTEVDAAAAACAERGAGGLDFLAGMPGTIGGAVWMNARCYGSSISDLLVETEILDEEYKRVLVPFRGEDFSYKRSPFQNREVLILSAVFRTNAADPSVLRRSMEEHRRDRESKGHYRLPSAGSAFKNDYAYGKPTGMIVDELGLRGLRVGGAKVADWHGNIIVNAEGATASDIRSLAEEVQRRVRAERGLELECEILFVGDWE